MEHKVTKALLRIIKEHCDSIEIDIHKGVLDGPPLSQQELHNYTLLKGEYVTFLQLLDPKEFLLTEYEEDKE